MDSEYLSEENMSENNLEIEYDDDEDEIAIEN